MSELRREKLHRRDFLAASAGLSAALAGRARAAERPTRRATESANADRIRVGLIGSGGRGTSATVDCIKAAPNVELWAIGDLFQDRVAGSLKRLRENKEVAHAVKVTPETSFWGFDAYQKVLACEVELVILAAPPGFRPPHFQAAIEVGKHVFMEKPVAVDVPGVRTVLEASELADRKGLCVVAGTQRRHQRKYLEVMRRIEDGAIGEIAGGACYWNQEGLWVVEQKPGMSDMEWQCRNWLYFTWLSGDHIVEQHVHNIDILNWALGGPPKSALGMGGREVRTDPKYGHIFDHFSVEYEYANGARVLSMCRQIDGASKRIAEHVVGTRGFADPDRGTITARRRYKFEGEDPNPYVLEHVDLIAAIRDGKRLNEGRRIAESTMTAILGRTSAYTGRQISWDWLMKNGQERLMPERLEFGPLAVPAVPVPGKTPLA